MRGCLLLMQFKTHKRKSRINSRRRPAGHWPGHGSDGTNTHVHSDNDRLNENWRKPRRSMNNGNCTEVAATAGMVAVRASKDPQGPVLFYPTASWASFLSAASNGRFDSLD